MPTSTLDQQIQKAYDEVNRKEKIAIHITHLDQRIIEEEARQKVLEKILDKEEKEYLKFDKTGIRNLFLKTLGNHQDQLDKEKQEYLLAYLKYNECVQLIDRLYQEKELLLQTIFGLFDADKKLEALLIDKRNSLPKNPDAEGIKILRLEKEIYNYQARIREIEEAIAAGKKTIPLLEKALEELKNIKNWGLFQYSGKGRYSSYKKKKYIDRATQEVFKVSELFEAFEHELHDVSKHYQLNYQQDLSFLKEFLSIFLQNLVTDWVIQKKIKNAIDGLLNAQAWVNQTQLGLKKEIQKSNQLIQQNQQAIKELLLQIGRKNKNA